MSVLHDYEERPCTDDCDTYWVCSRCGHQTDSDFPDRSSYCPDYMPIDAPTEPGWWWRIATGNGRVYKEVVTVDIGDAYHWNAEKYTGLAELNQRDECWERIIPSGQGQADVHYQWYGPMIQPPCTEPTP